MKLAIDLGSSTTKIYCTNAGNGIVLVEPSCVATVDGEVRAVGKEAKNLIGKTTSQTQILFPVYEGRIVDGRLAAEMLKRFFQKVGLSGISLFRADIVFSVPCGINPLELSTYATLAEEVGLRKVRFVEAPYLSALGAYAVMEEGNPVFCIDVGGGVTNVAVLSLEGIIAGFSMNIGGNNVDAAIIDYMQSQKGLYIGSLTAERLKNEIGSLSPNARISAVAEGCSVSSSLPSSIGVQSLDITPCITAYIDKILEYSKLVLNKLPAEVAANVNQSGVFLSGGLMKLPYVREYIASKLDMRAQICEEPQFAVVRGGGALVRDKKMLEKIAKKLEE
ncbi:MAG: rod shape-determining protein [Clostridia bacterium]|nr:rod shape-determining protein [Clostridia bacterium]